MTSIASLSLCLDTGPSPDPFVYNWTAWTEDDDWGNDSSQGHHNVFPDGKPFPRPPGWKKRNFVYVFHTLGWTSTNPLAASFPLIILTFFSYSIIENCNRLWV